MDQKNYLTNRLKKFRYLKKKELEFINIFIDKLKTLKFKTMESFETSLSNLLFIYSFYEIILYLV